VALLDCLNGIATHRRTLKTLANLLADVGYEESIRIETVRETGHLMGRELERMGEHLSRLPSLTLRGENADRNRK
jgi:hypothetical protein